MPQRNAASVRPRRMEEADYDWLNPREPDELGNEQEQEGEDTLPSWWDFGRSDGPRCEECGDQTGECMC